MKKVAFAVFASASLLAVPVFAATNGGNSNGMSSSSSSESSSNSQQQSPQQQMAARQKIVQNLRKDGFTDVHVVPDSFLVHAKNKEGQPVVMIINPDSVFSATLVRTSKNEHARNEQNNNEQSNNGQSNNGQMSNGHMSSGHSDTAGTVQQ